MTAYDYEKLQKLQSHMTIEESARMLCISTKTLKRIIKMQGVKTHKIRGTRLIRIPRSELLKIIEVVENG